MSDHEFTVYVLNPTRRFYQYDETFEDARNVAQDLVDRGGYDHAEVWENLLPIWAAWRGKGRRVYNTDKPGAKIHGV